MDGCLTRRCLVRGAICAGACWVASRIVMPTRAAAVTYDWAHTGQDHVINGSFEYPGIGNLRNWTGTPDGLWPGFSGGHDFYIDCANDRVVSTAPRGADQWHAAPALDARRFGWSSTGRPSQLEVTGVAGGRQDCPGTVVQVNYDEVSGNCFAELACNVESSVYQDVTTTPGVTYRWSLRHCSYSSAMDDSMCVMIGPPGATVPQRAYRTRANGAGDATGDVGMTIRTHNHSTTDPHNHEADWETYEGRYVIPAGQTTTRFTFEGLTSPDPKQGNNLDDIVFVISYPIGYRPNGATSGNVADQEKDKGATISLRQNGYSWPGHVFTGWDTSPSGNGTHYGEGQAYSADSALVLYAQWRPITYPVHYHGNGATAGTVDDQTKVWGDPLTLSRNGFSREVGIRKWRFVGWNESPDGTGLAWDEGSSFSDNRPLDLYAQWELIPGHANVGKATAPTW